MTKPRKKKKENKTKKPTLQTKSQKKKNKKIKRKSKPMLQRKSKKKKKRSQKRLLEVGAVLSKYFSHFSLQFGEIVF